MQDLYKTNAVGFKQFCFCKFYLIKPMRLAKRIPYLTQALSVQVKHNYINTKSLCVLCFTESKGLTFL